MAYKCDKCGKKFDSKKETEKHEKNCKGKERDKIKRIAESVNNEQFDKLNSSDKNNYVKEWFCECKTCGEKWHYLDDVEKEMKRQLTGNALIGLGMCCNPCGAIFSNKSMDLKREIDKLKQCPKCKSSHVKCEARYFRKHD